MTVAIPEPAHHSGCGRCETARCCVHFEPELTAADLWRLSRGRALAPEAFARLTPARVDQAGEDGIFLFDDGLAWLMRLRSRDEAPPEPDAASRPRHGVAPRACRLLMDLAPGVRRCGVYTHRPMRCRTFPTALTRMGVMVDTPLAICPPGAWAMERSDLEGARALHLHALVERDLYHALLTRWLQGLALRPDEPRADRVARFMAWLVNRWDAIAPCLAALAADGYARGQAWFDFRTQHGRSPLVLGAPWGGAESDPMGPHLFSFVASLRAAVGA